MLLGSRKPVRNEKRILHSLKAVFEQPVG